METTETTATGQEQTTNVANATSTEAKAPEREERGALEVAEESSSDKPQTMRSALRAAMKGAKDEPKATTVTEPAKAATATTTTPTPQAEPILPPQDLNAEERAAWSKLSPEMQKYISRRSHETTSAFSRRMQQLTEREKEISELESVAPYREHYAKRGVKVADVVRRAVAWDQAFEKDPINTAKEYLATYGIDPSELVGEGAPANARSEAVQQQSNYMTREDFERFQQEQKQAVALQSRFEALNSWMSSKPLFKDPGTAAQLEEAMKPLVSGFLASDPSANVQEILDKAYNYVTTADPRFSELVKALNAKESAARATAEAEKAATAAKTITGGPSGSTPRRNLNMRDELELRLKGAF